MPLIQKLSTVLAHPSIYLAYQYIVGGIRARKRCISEHVKPTEGLTVLDIGCGPGYAIESFSEPTYFGFDISPEYIEYANRKFNPPGKFFCQYFDEATLNWLPKIDVVLLMGVIHHLDDESAVQLLSLIKRVMSPSGKLYALDGCYQKGQSSIDKYFLDKDRGEHLRQEPAYTALATKVFPKVKGTVRKDLFYIPQTTLIMECSNDS